MIVTVKHMRKAGVCKDARWVFFEAYGLDWKRFVKEGMSVEELRACNHPIVNRVCDIAEAEVNE